MIFPSVHFSLVVCCWNSSPNSVFLSVGEINNLEFFDSRIVSSFLQELPQGFKPGEELDFESLLLILKNLLQIPAITNGRHLMWEEWKNPNYNILKRANSKGLHSTFMSKAHAVISSSIF